MHIIGSSFSVNQLKKPKNPQHFLGFSLGLFHFQVRICYFIMSNSVNLFELIGVAIIL